MAHFLASDQASFINFAADQEYRYHTRELKDDERLDTWFGHVHVKNLRSKDLIGVGRLLLAPVYPTR
jgi:hypothetical protein